MSIPALFLDRDGVINQMVAYLGDEPFDSPQSPDGVVLVDGISKVVKWANYHQIPVIEVTNQPGVAKGKMSVDTADKIESRVQELVSNEGGRIDFIYTCPHHPQAVIPELRQECTCRKPKPGLFLQSASEHQIDLSHSVIIGDGAGDMAAGQACHCRTIMLLHNFNLPAKVEESRQALCDFRITTPEQAIPILKEIFKV